MCFSSQSSSSIYGVNILNIKLSLLKTIVPECWHGTLQYFKNLSFSKSKNPFFHLCTPHSRPRQTPTRVSLWKTQVVSVNTTIKIRQSWLVATQHRIMTTTASVGGDLLKNEAWSGELCRPPDVWGRETAKGRWGISIFASLCVRGKSQHQPPLRPTDLL